MSCVCLFVILAVLPLGGLAAAPPAPVKDNLLVLGISFNQQGGDKHIDDYNCFPPEVEKVFREQGKDFYRKMQSRQVMGKQATYEGIMSGLAWLHKSAKKNDLVVMYLTSHGFCHPEKGWVIDTVDKKKLYGSELKAKLAKLPCPVLVLLETCNSGGFVTGKNDPPMPANVAAICACAANQETNNDLDIAFAEGLYGRADFNKDGVVNLDELMRYVRLRYKERWPKPLPHSQTPVMLKGKAMPGSLPLTKRSPDLVGVFVKGEWRSALKEKQVGGSFQVHLIGWSSTPGPYFLTTTVAREFVCLPQDGKAMLVKRGDAWSPARLVKAEAAGHNVHYLGQNRQETVAGNRIHYPFVGDPENPNYPDYMAAAGSRARVGPPGAWRDTLAVAVLNGQLYSVEKSGVLYVTDLATGTWKPIGKPAFKATTHLFAAGKSLYTIEKDGSLYRVNPGDGSWKSLGKAGDWRGTLAGVVHNGVLYTAKASGALYATDLAKGTWKALGKPEFAGTARMFTAGNSLYTIERDGSLYHINPGNGTWQRIGQQGDWKGTLAGAVVKGQLYTAEVSGVLYATNLKNGGWKPLGRPNFAGTAFMFAAGDKLYTIERNGTLYWVVVK
jgi:hypothetical protein